MPGPFSVKLHTSEKRLTLIDDGSASFFSVAIRSHLPDLNWRPTRYECVALPTELKWPAAFLEGNGVQI